MPKYLIDKESLSLYAGAEKNEFDVLKSRVDEITNLPEGSTSGDAELADIRIGANGTVYPTAGDAVRGQVNLLNTDISEIWNWILTGFNLTDLDDGGTYAMQFVVQDGHIEIAFAERS